jgi:hypothetical protein
MDIHNLYALEILVGERLTRARDAARRRDLAARATTPAPLRVRVGIGLVALGAWLRGAPGLVVAGQP